MMLGDVALSLLAGRGAGRRGFGPVPWVKTHCTSPRPSPLKGRGRRRRTRACHHPKTKRGPAFPPAPRCRRPLACPSGRRARRGGGRRCSTNRQGTWNPAFQRSLGVRWPVTGTGAVPKSRVPASMSLRSLPALRRSGIAVRSSIDTIPEGSFHSITSRRSFRPKARFPSRMWPHLPGLAQRRRRSAATRSTRSEDGLCVHGFRSGPLPEDTSPCPSACHPRHEAKDAIGRLSVPFAQSRCEHRLHGFPGWRPRPVPCGFPKAPAWFRP
jgi:hypothetical protein